MENAVIPFEQWVEQNPSLSKIWETIPEPTKTLLQIQITQYTKEQIVNWANAQNEEKVRILWAKQEQIHNG